MDQNASYFLKFDTGASTHVGRVRQANEDSFIVVPEVGLWAVADGVGGHEAGQMASQTVAGALATVGPAVSAEDQMARFQERLLRANDRIRAYSDERGGGLVGTTVAAFLVYDWQFRVAWAGDSRVYLIRNGAITQISRDHSEVQELLDQGFIKPEEAKSWPRRNVITRAIGIFDDLYLDVREGRVEPGDIFLLCSDGLTGHVSDAEIRDIVGDKRSQDACDSLINLTLDRGATDNVSIIVVRCHRAERTNFIPGSSTGEAQASS
jgi:serine/threonine protein phosphatase PrpC